MSSQSKIIKDILSTYDTILEHKKISEAEDVYDNIYFRNSGNSSPSRDNINITLLQDIQTAAKNAGVNVDITTAVSGHSEKTSSGNISRHTTGDAVDISVINGKQVSLSNRADADKLVDELIKMGYNKNAEGSSNPKAVLTFGFEGHNDHVHVSNVTSSSSNTTSGSSASTPTSTSGDSEYNIIASAGRGLLQNIGITESKVYSSFGNDYMVRNGEVVIPKENNKKIKSPVSGVITTFFYSNNCKNQLFIKFKVDENVFYLEYCGLNSILVRIGDKVNQGQVIGTSDDDIKVALYGSNGNKKYIDTKLETNNNESGDSKLDTGKYSNNDLNDGFYSSAYKKIKNSWFKKDKVQENIDRIKGLL